MTSAACIVVGDLLTGAAVAASLPAAWRIPRRDG
jgi:hypothetical protein